VLASIIIALCCWRLLRRGSGHHLRHRRHHRGRRQHRTRGAPTGFKAAVAYGYSQRHTLQQQRPHGHTHGHTHGHRGGYQ
jgi:hypothetical protein